MSTTPHSSDATKDRRPGDGHLMDHAYDGIREYDNPTPGWWHALFFGTVLFSLFYFVFFTFSPVAWTVQDTWAQRQVAENRKIFGRLGDLSPDAPTFAKVTGDAQLMSVAQGIFVGNCAACHAKDGGGINGVNLCDDYYKNVKTIDDIHNVIAKGAANGAMPAWEQRLSANERVILTAYVASLRGTTPQTPRAPEGEKIPPFDLKVGSAK
jgi:cytochrome c oxidase cbb3-type subunit 3